MSGSLRLPRPHPKYGVGKRMPGAVYVHRSAEHVLPRHILVCAQRQLPEDCAYEVVKFCESRSQLSFFTVVGFDVSPEPVQGRGWIVSAVGELKPYTPPSDPFIYHHKWLLVGVAYPGFDRARARERSLTWMKVVAELAVGDPAVRSKIGRKSYWDRRVLPLLPTQ